MRKEPKTQAVCDISNGGHQVKRGAGVRADTTWHALES